MLSPLCLTITSMYPEQPPNLPKLSPDYLDQIAPKPTKRLNLSPKQWLIFGGLGFLIIVVIGIIIIGNSVNNTRPTETLAARLQSTSKIVDDASSKIKSSSLRALNSNLKIYLTNTIRDIKEPLSKNKVNINKLSPDIVKAESGDKILSVLEDARLNNKYDRIYASEMAYQLNTIMALMEQIYKGSGGHDLKAFLEGAYGNLKPTQQQFAEFDETNY